VPAFFVAMLVGYAMTVAVETGLLLAGLSRRHPVRARLIAGAWLTACTYPVVWLVLPPLFETRWVFLLVAETFAPLAECVLFWLAFARHLPPDRRATRRDFGVIVAANVCSFAAGELFRWA
jgi:hypothetical protein